MSDTETIIKYLKLYNEWRRGDEKMGQPNPTEIGKLIDEACEMLTSLERERDEAITRRMETIMQCELYEQERDEAREAFVIATDQMVIAQGNVREANKERDEARDKYDALATEHMLVVNKLCEERDEARELLRLSSIEANALATSIQKSEYSDVNDFQLCESVAGVISQINNMYAGVREQRDEAREKSERYRLEANSLMLQRDEARESLKHIGEYGTEEINAAIDLRQKLASALVERDEAQKEFSLIYRWIERNHADGFIDSLTYLKNLERVMDCWYDRLDKMELERNEWKNKAYSHATDYTLMEAKCFRLEQQLKEYDKLKS